MIGRLTRVVRRLSESRDRWDLIDHHLTYRLYGWRMRRQARLNDEFDRRHGTDTASEIHLVDAGLSADSARRGNGVYRPFWASSFAAALKALRIDYARFTFFDIGSGKGKLLLLASDYPFRRIAGIEIAPLLHEIARNNIAIYRGEAQQCHDIVAELGDATTCVLPAGPLVCMVFNAFEADTMRIVLRNIERQVGDDAREFYLIYGNVRRVKEMERAFDDLSGLTIIRRTRHEIVLANDFAMRKASQRPA